MQILWRLEYKQDGHSESASVIEESTREKEPEIQTVAAPKRTEKRPLLIVDIPNFQLGNIYIILNLFVIPPVIASHVVMFVMALPSSNRYVNLHDLIYSSWVILGLGFFIFCNPQTPKTKELCFCSEFYPSLLGYARWHLRNDLGEGNSLGAPRQRYNYRVDRLRMPCLFLWKKTVFLSVTQ
jgi:hypothetical protein